MTRCTFPLRSKVAEPDALGVSELSKTGFPKGRAPNSKRHQPIKKDHTEDTPTNSNNTWQRCQFTTEEANHLTHRKVHNSPAGRVAVICLC